MLSVSLNIHLPLVGTSYLWTTVITGLKSNSLDPEYTVITVHTYRKSSERVCALYSMVNAEKYLILAIPLHSNFGGYLEDLAVCSTLPGRKPVFEINLKQSGLQDSNKILFVSQCFLNYSSF